MNEKIAINLKGAVPASAIAVTFVFKAHPDAKALLYHFEGDQSPAVVNGPCEMEVNVSASKTLYLERLDDHDWHYTCTGYRF